MLAKIGVIIYRIVKFVAKKFSRSGGNNPLANNNDGVDETTLLNPAIEDSESYPAGGSYLIEY